MLITTLPLEFVVPVPSCVALVPSVQTVTVAPGRAFDLHPLIVKVTLQVLELQQHPMSCLVSPMSSPQITASAALVILVDRPAHVIDLDHGHAQRDR